MEERLDEKILDYINAAEKKEEQKDICNGPIKIGKKFYEFEEAEFFDGKIKMYIPNTFEDMPLEAKKLKYPSENRPDIIKSNENGSIAVTFKLIDSYLTDEQIEELKDAMKMINNRLNPSNIYFDEGILEVEEKKIGYFDFKSSAIDDFLYNFIFLFALQEKTIMGTFSCSYSEYDEWKDIVVEMVNTLKTKKVENN
ncbi:hypothetical protein [Clostridium sp. YIM B02555]|uniref:hypothetical protein n=1 Tax=Clostridium sp. YIM B02555 TaxID=2911968 RepID=UPI001EEE4537|nr:hypothetical protein [Clostridium sp. YIM B02555]